MSDDALTAAVEKIMRWRIPSPQFDPAQLVLEVVDLLRRDDVALVLEHDKATSSRAEAPELVRTLGGSRDETSPGAGCTRGGGAY